MSSEKKFKNVYDFFSHKNSPNNSGESLRWLDNSKKPNVFPQKEIFDLKNAKENAKSKTPEQVIGDFQFSEFDLSKDKRKFLYDQLSRYAKDHPEMNPEGFLDSLPQINKFGAIYIEALSMISNIYGKDSLGALGRECKKVNRIYKFYDIENDSSLNETYINYEHGPYINVVRKTADSSLENHPS